MLGQTTHTLATTFRLTLFTAALCGAIALWQRPLGHHSAAALPASPAPFASPVTYATGLGPFEVVAADFNGDGFPDLVTRNVGPPGNTIDNGSASVLLNLGNGTYGPFTDYFKGKLLNGDPIRFNLPRKVRTGDFNNDGKQDFFVVDGDMYFFQGKGDGTFFDAIKVRFDFAHGDDLSNIGGFLVIDLNNDGKLDLVYSDPTPANKVRIRLGNGNFTFGTVNILTTGTLPIDVVAHDFDGDNKLDLVTANQNANSLSYFKGNGDGTFAAKVDIAVDRGPISLKAADFNRDGKLDLGVLHQIARTFIVLLGNGNGTFNNIGGFPTQTSFAPPDEVLRRQQAKQFPAVPAAAPTPGTVTPSQVVGYWPFFRVTEIEVIFDVLYRDLVGDLYLHQGNGDGTFNNTATKIQANSANERATLVDTMNMGRCDVLTANRESNYVTVYKQMLIGPPPPPPPDEEECVTLPAGDNVKVCFKAILQTQLCVKFTKVTKGGKVCFKDVNVKPPPDNSFIYLATPFSLPTSATTTGPVTLCLTSEVTFGEPPDWYQRINGKDERLPSQCTNDPQTGLTTCSAQVPALPPLTVSFAPTEALSRNDSPRQAAQVFPEAFFLAKVIKPPGPGIIPVPDAVNDQKPGALLVYNFYTSNPANPAAQNTRIAITNTAPNSGIFVHLFFVDGSSCSVADNYLCLTANQTASFLASDIDPGTTGYLIAVAVDRQGCPIRYNQLIGDAYVKTATGHAANLAAEGVSFVGAPVCDTTQPTTLLRFDGVAYTTLPRALALSNLPSRADGNDTLLVINRIGGNLATGAATLTDLFGLLYDDTEKVVSFSFSPGVCQFRSSLSNSFPRTAPRIEQFIPAGRSGWLKLWLQNDGALLGATLNFNARAGAAAHAFNQGHNLHKLTFTSAAVLTIPIFPPAC